MRWPDQHSCHEGTPSPFTHLAKGIWRAPEVSAKGCIARPDDYGPYIYPFRTCDYCGSLNPEDLFNLTQAHPDLITMEVADWKGWPHKLYVSGIPNPLVGVPTVRSARYQNGICTPGEPRPEGPSLTHKFYNEHLLDGMDEDARLAITTEIWKRTGVSFSVDGSRLSYRCLPFVAH